MTEQLRKSIDFARSHASTGGPESIQALITLADEVTRLQLALDGARVIVEVARSTLDEALHGKPITLQTVLKEELEAISNVQEY